MSAHPGNGRTEDGSFREKEPAFQRADRHWGELLQELRVTQAGVQILAGLLFTVPFQSRFDSLSGAQRVLYLVATSLATLSAALLIAPVAYHRALFRRRLRSELIEVSDRITKLGLGALALSLSLVLCLVFSVVAGWPAAWVAAGVSVTFFLVLWVLLPIRSAAGAEPVDD